MSAYPFGLLFAFLIGCDYIYIQIPGKLFNRLNCTINRLNVLVVDRELLDVVTIILGSEFKNASVIVAKHILKFNVNGLVKHNCSVLFFLL